MLKGLLLEDPQGKEKPVIWLSFYYFYIQNRNYMPFTCENGRFKTDTSKGYPHGIGLPMGSVTPSPIWDDGETLYLEHVIDKQNGNNCFWFMWYDEYGNNKINVSAVFGEGDILEIIKNISKIKF